MPRITCASLTHASRSAALPFRNAGATRQLCDASLYMYIDMYSSASPGAPAPRAAPRPRSSSLGPVARPPSRGQLHHRWDDAAGFIPITKAAQVTSDIQKFVFAYCQVHGLNSELQLLAAEQFSKRLQQEAGRHADGGGGDLMAPVRATAALLQRSVEWEITTRSSARC